MSVQSAVKDVGVATGVYTYESVSTEIARKKTSLSGTSITWKPDEGVFEDNTISFDKVYDLVQILSYATPGLAFEISYNGKEYYLKSKGVEDFLIETLKKERMLSPIMSFKNKTETLEVEGAMVWSSEKPEELSLVNLIPTSDHGTHVTALKTTLTREVNKIIGADFKGEELRSGWSFILSVKTLDEPVFKGQSKDTLNMPTINAPLSALLRESLVDLIKENQKFFEDLKSIIEKMREKEEAVTKIKEVLNKSRAKANPIPDKLKPALNKKGAELFIAEGDSAAGGLISYRDIYKHAIMALKGKPINVKKHEINKVLKNKEIQDLIIALGGFGADFNSSKCAYDKIIIMTDADVDGAHIGLLLLTFFNEFYPQLVREGKIYTIQTPLYMIKSGSNLIYKFTESEMEKYQTKKTDIISRIKGLGELDPRLLGEFAFGPKRILKQLFPEDEAKLAELLEQVMGQDSSFRKELIEQ